MNYTEALRQEFGRDEIKDAGDVIQIYWHRDRNGIWCPADGGPIKHGTAKRRVYAFAKKIQDSRDRLPDGIRECNIQVGEMSSDGNFEALTVHRFVKGETDDETVHSE